MLTNLILNQSLLFFSFEHKFVFVHTIRWSVNTAVYLCHVCTVVCSLHMLLSDAYLFLVVSFTHTGRIRISSCVFVSYC